MMKRILLTIGLLSICSHAFAMTWHPVFLSGYGYTFTHPSQNLWLALTPAPGENNQYISHNNQYGSALFGFALENNKNVSIEFDYLRNNGVNGTVKPLVNIAPDFDQLKFVYDIHTYLLQGIAKYVKHNIVQYLDGYLLGGAGFAVNRLTDYREYPENNSSAAPMLLPFGGKSTVNPAFSIGAGVSHTYGAYTKLSLEYRFYYTGMAQLAKSPVEQTSAAINLPHLYWQFLVLGLSLGELN